MRREGVLRAEPNPAHLALARLEELVPRFTLITQNVDGLHRRAGSRTVVELHGDITRVRCSREGTAAGELGRASAGGEPPKCAGCGAYLRPDVVWFGETLPEKALHRAWAAAYDCDVFSGGGDLEPGGARGVVCPGSPRRRAPRSAVINTSMEGQRSGVGIHHLTGPAGEVLSGLVARGWPV